MTLTAAMARLTDVAEILKSRLVVDEALREICEDYRVARQTLIRIKKEKPRPTKKVAEYTTMVQDLEDEIVEYLLGGKPIQSDE